MKQNSLTLSTGKSMLLLLCLFVICYLITAVLSYVIGRIMSGRPDAAIRISALAQDVIVFIVPAVATAVLSCRRPAELLGLMQKPQPLVLLLVAAVLAVSIPLMDAVIYWNYNISLPSWMAGFEALCRQMEELAQSTLNIMLADTSIPALILNILIVGIAAGVSEELLFRGCMQRLLTAGGVNAHLAIWAVAFLFSAMHLQIFGFVPRMLLGAYFGYLLLWSGSLWVPVTAHVLNNTVYVVTLWLQARQGITAESQPTLHNLWLTLASLVLTTLFLAAIYRLCRRQE